METPHGKQLAMSVSRNSIAANVLLAAFKLFAGLSANSAAMVSDAVHTLSDIVSTIVVIIGIRLAHEKPDKEHLYGHERMECIAAILLAAMLLATGVGIGYDGVRRIWAGGKALAVPGVLALAAAIASIAIKEAMYWYTRWAAQKIDSGALMADAWHHRSDALSSVGSFVGILGARLGFPILDSIACLVICVFIVKAACQIFLDAIGKMTDKACDDAFTEKIRGVILQQEEVLAIDTLKTRLFGDRIYVDVEISTHDDASLVDAHNTAHRVHDALEKKFPKVKHCMVHVNPSMSEHT